MRRRRPAVLAGAERRRPGGRRRGVGVRRWRRRGPGPAQRRQTSTVGGPVAEPEFSSGAEAAGRSSAGQF